MLRLCNCPCATRHRRLIRRHVSNCPQSLPAPEPSGVQRSARFSRPCPPPFFPLSPPEPCWPLLPRPPHRWSRRSAGCRWCSAREFQTFSVAFPIEPRVMKRPARSSTPPPSPRPHRLALHPAGPFPPEPLLPRQRTGCCSPASRPTAAPGGHGHPVALGHKPMPPRPCAPGGPAPPRRAACRRPRPGGRPAAGGPSAAR
jgi:hypothetical protein